MPKNPSFAIFTCESCGRASRADERMAQHILPNMRNLPIEANGTCRHCKGGSWTISIVYAEKELDVAETALGIGLGAVTGIGFVQHSTSTSQTDYSNTPAAIVAQINVDPGGRLSRVAQFARDMEQTKLLQQGGRPCLSCGAFFLPNSDRTWNQKGYCCKVCLVKAEGPLGNPELAKTNAVANATAKTIQVRCESGHVFSVPIMFSGSVRRCPECGKKTPVPQR